MKKNIAVVVVSLVLMSLLSPFKSWAQQLGDPGWEFDESKYDSRIVAMPEWAKAGVEGGIPYREDNEVKQTLTADNNDEDMAGEIQTAINSVASQGGGVVLLTNGTYRIKSQIKMKSNVILRGESREGTIIESTHRVIADPDNAAKFHEYDLSKRYIRFGALDNGIAWRVPTIFFDGVQRAALEDFTMVYRVWEKTNEYEGEEVFPTDKDYELDKTKISTARRQTSFNENRYIYPSSASYDFSFDNPVRHDMFATFVKVDGDASKNIWIDNCSFLNSGTDHLFIQAGSHITIRNTKVSGAYQKAGQGNGYGINSYGSYVLMVNCDVRKTRHWAIQKGAIYNVIYDSYSEVDINFHQDDLGSNIIENTEIIIPQYHTWKNPFQVGAGYHRPPGTSNFFYNNDVSVLDDNLNYNKKFDDDRMYTFIDREVEVSELITPEQGVLYAIKRSNVAAVELESISLSKASLSLEAGEKASITASFSPSNATNKRIEWTSSNTEIATVANGVVTAVKEGAAVITAKAVDGGFIKTCSVTVKKSTKTVFELSPIQDAYLQGSSAYDNTQLKVEDGNRVAYLMFDLSSISNEITSLELQMTVAGDAGSGELNVHKGNNTSWTESDLSTSNAPSSEALLGTINTSYSVGSTHTLELDASAISSGKLSLVLSQNGGNDVWFSSKEGSNAPTLVVTTKTGETPVDDVDGGLLTNAGLESGDLSSWATAGSTFITADANSGDYAVKIQDAGQLYQIVELKANTTYTASCYAKVGAASESVFFGVTNNSTSTLVESVKVEGTAYSQQAITFTTGADIEEYKVWFWNNTGGDYFVDDFHLEEDMITQAVVNDQAEVIAYPSPFNDVLNLNLGGKGVVAVNVYNATGCLVYSMPIGDASIVSLNLELDNGLYFVQLEGANQQIIRIVKN